jgi:protein-tyrosine phosphatase
MRTVWLTDGPSSIEEAVAVAGAAAQEGVRTLAATPHVRSDHPAVRPRELARRTEALSQACTAAGVHLELVPAGEVDLAWAQQASDDELAAASYHGAGRDLLVETPYGELPAAFEDLLFGLSARGFRLLLAHPERSPTFQRAPERLRALLDRGVLLQLTAATIASPDRRSRSRRLARALLRESAAHVIASDRHGPALGRGSLRDGVTAAARESGERAEWMVTDAPAAILAGDPLPPPPAAQPPRWRRLRRG